MEDVLIENEFLNSNSVSQSIYHLVLLEMVIDSESQSRQVVVTVPLSSNSEGGLWGNATPPWIPQWFSYASEFCGRRKVYDKRAHILPYFAAIDPPALLHYAGW